jgi:REP element-mobilizing transposase RayT
MNQYNPHIHHRRSIHLKGYDYSQAGLYFITICCQDRICRFGDVVNDEMVLNEYGNVAFNEWVKLSERFSNFEMDVFQIMPNHMHGIILLTDVGATLAVAQINGDAQNYDDAHNDDDIRAGASPAPTIFDIVGAYKSLVANGCLDIYKSKNKTMGKLWQRNYYEHIIRNAQSYQTISEYIINNPVKWADDKFFMK